MRLLCLLFTLLCLGGAVLAWDKEDYEIFDLQAAIERTEGKGTTFYSLLEVSSTASSIEISKAYRKKSQVMHPDKNPGVKDIAERYARLNVVQKILRSENRDRYDFFYKNGFPRWRGTGYYYSRFRPGLGSVLVFLALVTAGVQNLVHRMNYKRDVARVESIMASARRAAWGPKLTKIEGRRKVRINIGRGGVQVDEDGNEISMGPSRPLDMVVEGDNVWILEEDGSLVALDLSVATPPSYQRLWPVALALTVAGLFSKKTAEPEKESSSSEDESDSVTRNGHTGPNGVKKGGGNLSAPSRRRVPTRKQ